MTDAAYVGAICRSQGFATTSDGEVIPVTLWVADGKECERYVASHAIAGPHNGKWWFIDLSEFSDMRLVDDLPGNRLMRTVL